MARVASMERIARILAMVPWILQHPDDATVSAVCARFGIQEEELLDDLNLLFMCGIPPFEPGDLIEAGIEGDHVVIRMADYLARPLRLTRWEAVTLLAAGKAIGALDITESSALSTALAKIENAIDPDEAAAAGVLADRIEIDMEPAPTEALPAIRDAIEHRRTLSIDYYTLGREELATRDVEPLLVFGSGPWYLVAFDHRSGDRRTFRVDRIRRAEPTGATFERPADFDHAAYAQAPLYHPSPEDIEVVLRLAPDASWVVEVTPHDKATRGKDGTMTVTLRTGSMGWLEHLLLSLGPSATVVTPPELAAAVADRAAQTLKRY